MSLLFTKGERGNYLSTIRTYASNIELYTFILIISVDFELFVSYRTKSTGLFGSDIFSVFNHECRFTTLLSAFFILLSFLCPAY